MLSVPEMQHVKVVPVDGQNDVFALGYIDAAGVTVAADGTIRIMAGGTP